MHRLPPHLAATLDQLREKSQFRSLRMAETGEIDFCSNDYLGLAKVHSTTDAMQAGSGGSRLLSGNHPVHLTAERRIAEIFQAEDALLFANGYMANMGLLSAIATRHDTYLYDEAIHASMREGIRMSMASSFSFRHNDLQHLEERLQMAKGNVFVCTEGLFSMDGDFPDLRAMIALVERHGAYLIVDEAHSTGLLGPQGAGLVVDQGLQDRVMARVHTFGKAAGRSGAAVVGSKLLKDFLINRSRTFIYTTAPSPAEVASWLGGIEQMVSADDERARLWELIDIFRREWKNGGLPTLSSPASPITSVVIPGNERVRAAANACQAAGFDIRAILAPTVPEGTERIRLVLHAFNSKEEIDGLLQVLKFYLH